MIIDESTNYEEVRVGFLGNIKEINVYDSKNDIDIRISRDTLKRVYEDLMPNVFDSVVKAHDSLLEHGYLTGNEKLIAININNGKWVVDKNGETIKTKNGIVNRVEWQIPIGFKGELITVHNHVFNKPFSYADLYSFNDIEFGQVKFMVVQCHNGTIYTLKRLKNSKRIEVEKVKNKDDEKQKIIAYLKRRHGIISVQHMAELYEPVNSFQTIELKTEITEKFLKEISHDLKLLFGKEEPI